MTRRRQYEPEEIMQRIKITGLPRADFSPYDGAGWEYIIDLPNRQAFRLTIEPWESLDADDEPTYAGRPVVEAPSL